MISAYSILNETLGFFSPISCAVCGNQISRERNGICRYCEIKLERLTNHCCSICSGNVENDHCSDCSDRCLYYDRNISLFTYAGAAETLVHSLKFSGRRDLAPFFAVQAKSLVSTSGINPDIITYIPSVPSRERKRGYNQSKIIAKELSTRTGLQFAQLISVKETGDQKKMHFNERFLNILGRFQPAGSVDIRGKKILIIDDIFTTGATINEAARILKKMGSQSVFSLTIARVDAKKS